MPLKLTIINTDEPAPQPDAFIFQQDRITIGRDRANDVPLVDTKRIISKQHAEIVVSDTTMHLTDLGSKNATYLNEERLQARHPHPLVPGDTFRIGPYEIGIAVLEAELEPSDTPLDDTDRTIFDASFVNPFEDSVTLLAVALRSLAKQYDEEPPSYRDEALDDALDEAMKGELGHPAYLRVARRLAPEALPTAMPPAPPPEPSVEPAPAPPTTGDAARINNLLDVVLQEMAQLIGVPWKFRHEFIGQTIVQTERTAFLYEGDAETLKQHLLAPALSEEDVTLRLQLFEEALIEVERHQVAIIDGYKAGVREGALRLIDQLNPDLLEQEAARTNALYRFIPLLAKAEVLRRLRDQLGELRAEDWSAAERRTYRPAFIKAYLARMTAMR